MRKAIAQPLMAPSTAAALSFSIFSPASGLRASGRLEQSPFTWRGQINVNISDGKQRNSMCVLKLFFFSPLDPSVVNIVCMGLLVIHSN